MVDSQALLRNGVAVALREPWLASSAIFAGMGGSLLFLSFCWNHPWLPFFAAALVCICVQVVKVILFRGGLLPLMPGSVKPALQQPFFNIFQAWLQTMINYVCNALRVVILASMELGEEERHAILEGLDPEFRSAVFQQPLLQALPNILQRILLGTNVRRERIKSDREAKLAPKSQSKQPLGIPPLVMPQPDCLSSGMPLGRQRIVPPLAPLLSGRQWTEGARSRAPSDASSDAPVRMLFSDTNPMQRQRTHSGCSEVSSVPSKRSHTMTALLDVVRGMESSKGKTHINATVSSLHHVMKGKAAGTAGYAARALVSSARSQTFDACSYAVSKASEFAEGAREVVSDPTNQVTAASAVGGAVTLGAGGGVAGLVSGGVLGALCGVVPALFTFGLSIPIGAVIGSGAGFCVGSTVAGTTGFIGGGAAGYYVYGKQDNSDAQSVASDTSESSDLFTQ